MGIVAAGVILGAGAEGDADAEVGLGIHIPAHRPEIAAVDAGEAGSLKGAGFTRERGLGGDVDAFGVVPRAAAVVGVVGALLSLGAVLDPRVAGLRLPARVVTNEGAAVGVFAVGVLPRIGVGVGPRGAG